MKKTFEKEDFPYSLILIDEPLKFQSSLSDVKVFNLVSSKTIFLPSVIVSPYINLFPPAQDPKP